MYSKRKENLSQMVTFLTKNKDIYENSLSAMKRHTELDFEKMFNEDGNLFDFFIHIHRKTQEQESYDIEKFWTLRLEAYNQLKKDGFFQLDMTNEKIALVKTFEEKIAGPCLIPKDKLEETMTVATKKGQKSVYFDYHQVLELIEQYYDIEARGFFDKLKEKTYKDICLRYFDSQTYDKVTRISPVDNLQSNYFRVVFDFVVEKIAYIDFWHYMLDNDFSEIENGSKDSISRPEDKEIVLENVINDREEFEDYFAQKIKAVFYKELSQIQEFKANQEIEVMIEW